MQWLSDMALFVEVAKTRSFTKAANNLAMPTSTLSRRISQLEQHLGLRLLNRSTRSLELTEAGQQYYERGQWIVSEAQAAQEDIMRLNKSPSGLIRLSLAVDFGMYYIAPLVTAFTQRYPLIRFDLDLSARRADLLSEPVDMAIRMGELADSSLYARLIAHVPLGLYAAPTYLAQYGIPQHPDDLQHHQCIDFKTNDGKSVWHLSQRQQHYEFSVNAAIRLNNMGMAQQLACMGLGICLLGKQVAAPEVQRGQLVPVLSDWQLPLVPAYALTATRLLPQRLRLWLDFLAEGLGTA
jgi:DNA-binding transcriptional LysR family regulator